LTISRPFWREIAKIIYVVRTAPPVVNARHRPTSKPSVVTVMILKVGDASVRGRRTARTVDSASR
jgi:hypothetical protein